VQDVHRIIGFIAYAFILFRFDSPARHPRLLLLGIDFSIVIRPNILLFAFVLDAMHLATIQKLRTPFHIAYDAAQPVAGIDVRRSCFYFSYLLRA